LQEIDLAGNIIRQLPLATLQQEMQAAGYDFVPTAIHHDIMPLPNGHLILLVNFPKNFTNVPGYGNIAIIGDGIIDLDQNWQPVWAWNSFDETEPNGPLSINRHLAGLPDWTHSNGLVYLPEDGNLLLSMRQQSWVLKIDYSNGTGTGNILWRLGYQGDFALTENGIPTEDPSQWFSFQHFPSFISQNGSTTTIAIWDNGDQRVNDDNGVPTPCGAPSNYVCFSRGTIFQIDESSMVADLSWVDLPQLYGLWGGSINQLGNTNIEFDANALAVPPSPNVASQVEEVTQSGQQLVWQMQFTPATATAYRAYRIPSLYPGVTWQF
jgi:arylsulfate sulfotransferase